MNKADLEVKAAKCFDSFDTYWRELCAFREDYLFFEMYMKRNSKSDVAFLPSVYLKSFQSVINDYPKTEDGLERAFNVFTIARQIILELQEWNGVVYEESERNAILKEWSSTNGLILICFVMTSLVVLQYILKSGRK